MPQRLIKEGILVLRNGKRVRPAIGKVFDLTEEEIRQLEAVRPQAIAKIRGIEKDPQSVAVSEKTGAPLADMSKEELLTLAAKMGLDVRKNASKDTLIEAIEAARNQSADDDL
jgi:hypothetical protein